MTLKEIMDAEQPSGEAVHSSDLVSLPDVKELPKPIANKIRLISENDWTEDDWLDLLRLQRIVRHNIAVRHGLLRMHEWQCWLCKEVKVGEAAYLVGSPIGGYKYCADCWLKRKPQQANEKGQR